MNNLLIEATKQSPAVYLNADEGIIRFNGKSRPEDALIFFDPVIKWIKTYISDPQEQTTVIFNLEYFNSATTKVFKTLLESFQKISLQGKELNCEWHYQEEDEDMLEVGEELASLYHLPFSFIPYKPD